MVAPKYVKSTAQFASKRPHKVIDQEAKVNVIKAYAGGTSVLITLGRSGTSHLTVAVDLKDKNKVREAMDGSTSRKTMRPTTF